MANKMIIVSKCIQSNQMLSRHPSNFKRARICKPAMAFVTDINIDKFGTATGTVLLVLSDCGIYGTVFYITFCAQMMIIVKQCPPRSMMPLLVHRLHLNAECSL